MPEAVLKAPKALLLALEAMFNKPTAELVPPLASFSKPQAKDERFPVELSPSRSASLSMPLLRSQVLGLPA